MQLDLVVRQYRMLIINVTDVYVPNLFPAMMYAKVAHYSYRLGAQKSGAVDTTLR